MEQIILKPRYNVTLKEYVYEQYNLPERFKNINFVTKDGAKHVGYRDVYSFKEILDREDPRFDIVGASVFERDVVEWEYTCEE